MSAPGFNQARERHWVCAQRLRQRRHALGLTQREVVARLHGLGVRTTNRTLSAMENGRGLDLGLLPELAESLDCTVTYLLGLTATPDTWQPDMAAPPVRRSPNNGVDRHPSAISGAAGILGSELPAGFAAPSRIRRRNGSTPTF